MSPLKCHGQRLQLSVTIRATDRSGSWIHWIRTASFCRHFPRRNEPEHDHQGPALFDENIKMWSKTAGHRLCMRQKLTVTGNMDAGFSLHPNIEVREHLQQQHPFCSQQLIEGHGYRLEPASIQRSSWTSPSTKRSSINWQRSYCAQSRD